MTNQQHADEPRLAPVCGYYLSDDRRFIDRDRQCECDFCSQARPILKRVQGG